MRTAVGPCKISPECASQSVKLPAVPRYHGITGSHSSHRAPDSLVTGDPSLLGGRKASSPQRCFASWLCSLMRGVHCLLLSSAPLVASPPSRRGRRQQRQHRTVAEVHLAPHPPARRVPCPENEWERETQTRSTSTYTLNLTHVRRLEMLQRAVAQ